MNSSNHEPAPIKELKEFLSFLRGLWSTLAGVSVFFPLSNVLTKVIPLGRWEQDEGGLTFISPALVTTLATVGCLFTILWSFVQRDRYARSKKSSLRKLAVLSLLGGAVALSLYLATSSAIVMGFYYDVLGWESDDVRRIIGDLVLLATYSGFFALTTRAFLLLGLIEYFRKSERER